MFESSAIIGWKPRRPVTIVGEQNAVFCSRTIPRVNGFRSQNFSARPMVPFMSGSLFDITGRRKYLVASEREAFVRAANVEGGSIGTFCLTLALTGARISEVLALTAERIDVSAEAIVFETLKRRRKCVFRANPVPRELLAALEVTHGISKAFIDSGRANEKLWTWGRTHAWKQVKRVMRIAGIADHLAKPKALRHAFAVEAGQNGVQLNIVQRWMGHARIETTAIPFAFRHR